MRGFHHKLVSLYEPYHDLMRSSFIYLLILSLLYSLKPQEIKHCFVIHTVHKDSVESMGDLQMNQAKFCPSSSSKFIVLIKNTF